ncbi:hypothetical protein EDD11_005370 [Mortierella claussenii]|nr:hypothetical protein EDD11_005370 [Mortierella claussenii]
MTVDDGEMQKLWKLTNELTAQLVFNRNAALELKQQLAHLQAKTSGQPPMLVHYSYGGEHYQSDYMLKIANERLKEENSQLQEQLREYERWMEYIMGKFRLQNFAMAQSRKDSMHEAYKMAEQGGEAAVRLQEENTLLQTRLADLGAVARKAIHEEYYTTESMIESLEEENRGLREMLGVAAAEDGMGPISVSGRLKFHRGPNGGFFMTSTAPGALGDGYMFGDDDDDDDDDDERAAAIMRHGGEGGGVGSSAGNRISFPSTGTGSHLGSSESDYEQPQQQQPRSGEKLNPLYQLYQQPLSPTPSHSNQDHGFAAFKSPTLPAPLSVQTGGLRSPSGTATPSLSSSSMPSPCSFSSTASPISPTWSSSTSTSGSTLISPGPYASAEQFKSISPSLEDATAVRGGAAGAERKDGRSRGEKLTINTKDLGSLKANRVSSGG